MNNRVAAGMAALLAAGVLVGSGSSAWAQDESAKPTKPWRVKVGGFFPTKDAVKDTLGSTWAHFGVSYDFQKTLAEKPITYFAFVDGTNKSKDVSSPLFRTEYSLGYTGIGGGARFFLTPPDQTTQFYAGAGLGVYLFRGETKVNGVRMTDYKDTKFGGKLLGGVQLNQGIFAEADYTLPGESDANGFNLAVGFRF